MPPRSELLVRPSSKRHGDTMAGRLATAFNVTVGLRLMSQHVNVVFYDMDIPLASSVRAALQDGINQMKASAPANWPKSWNWKATAAKAPR